MPKHISAKASAAIVFCCALTAPSAALADDKVDLAAYPELAPEAVLPAILAELRHSLPDVYSVREMRVCPASKIKLKDGKPTDWVIRYEFNAKNQAGGYTGIRRDVAIFKNGRIAYPTGNSPQLGREGLDGVFSRMVDKQMAPCKSISDATVQQMIANAQ